MLKKLFKKFNFLDIDGHYIIIFFGIQIRIKHKQKYSIPKILKSGVTKEKRQIPIVATLTTFKSRIDIVHITLKSLLNQDLKPDYIVLYLSKLEFENLEDDLPNSLLELLKYGVQIRWTDDNIKSYKKLIPALNEFSKDTIFITFDDDIVYKKDTISKLYNTYLKNPNSICAIRAARLEVKNDKIYNKKMSSRLFEDYTKPSYLNRLTGCGGVLYPPNSLHDDVTKKEIFLDLIPTHDDVWFWTMAVLNNTKIINVDGALSSLTLIENSQNVGLCKINNSKMCLSTQDVYGKILLYYPTILQKLKSEGE